MTSSLPSTLSQKDIVKFYKRKFKDLHPPYLLAMALSFGICMQMTDGQLDKVMTTPCGQNPKITQGFTIIFHLLGLGGLNPGIAYPIMAVAWFNTALYLCILVLPWLLKIVRTSKSGAFSMIKICSMVVCA